jgi:hypothetical protein
MTKNVVGFDKLGKAERGKARIIQARLGLFILRLKRSKKLDNK